MIEVRRNIIRNNEVGVIATYGWGAGLLVYGEGSVAVSERNVYTENHAMSLGSGAFVDDGASVTFVNDLFHHNDCSTAGAAAIYVRRWAVGPVAGQPNVGMLQVLVSTTTRDRAAAAAGPPRVRAPDEALLVTLTGRR